MASELRSLIRSGFTTRQALALQGEVAGVAQDNASGEGALFALNHSFSWPDLLVSCAYPTAAGGRHHRTLTLPTVDAPANTYLAGVRAQGHPAVGITWFARLYVSKVGGGTATFAVAADQAFAAVGSSPPTTLVDSVGAHGMAADTGGDIQTLTGGVYSIAAHFFVDLAY